MLKLISAPNDRGRSEEGYAVFDDARCVGHILRTSQSPEGKPWFWMVFESNLHGMNDCGYATSRKEAVADFKVLWESVARV
jgi:hypothetical protein